MSTLKQIEANRSNSAKSTGPRTESGKAVTRLNAFKTGIDAATQVLPGESAEDFAALTAQYYDFYQPNTPDQQIQLDIVISSEWFLRRLRRVEHNIWDAEFQEITEGKYTGKTRLFGDTFKCRSDTFRHLQHRINSTNRQLQSALRILRQLQLTVPPAAPPAAPDPEPVPLEPVTPKIGLVPQLRQPYPNPLAPTTEPGLK